MAQRKKRSRKNDPKIPIDKLLAYWVDLSKRPTLTQEDFKTFLRMASDTYGHFLKFYGWYRTKHVEMAGDKFFTRLHSLVAWQGKILEEALKFDQLTDREYVTMRDFAKKFIPRIKRCFGQQLVQLRADKTPLQDAEDLIGTSTKLTYRWVAGIVASNYIAGLLIRLSKYAKDEKVPRDDITTLYDSLKNRTKSPRLKTFLTRSYQRFKDADKIRNRCAHINEGDPTHQEVVQSIQLARLLQKFV